MKNPKELLESFIARNNDNPLTSKKFFLEYKKEYEKEECKQFLTLIVEDKEAIKTRTTDNIGNEVKNELNLYHMMLECIYEGLYDRLKTETFDTNPISKIVRIEK